MSLILGKFYFDVRVMEVDLAYSDDDIYAYQILLADEMELFNFCMDTFVQVMLIKLDLTNFYSYSYSTTSLEISINRTYAHEISAITS